MDQATRTGQSEPRDKEGRWSRVRVNHLHGLNVSIYRSTESLTVTVGFIFMTARVCHTCLGSAESRFGRVAHRTL
jgi:hypothetical protein